MSSKKKKELPQSGHRYGKLQEIVGWLNDAPTTPGEIGKAWKAVEAVMCQFLPEPSRDQQPRLPPTLLGQFQPWRFRRAVVSLAAAARAFNDLARDAPVRLVLVPERATNGSVRVTPALRADDLLPIVLRQVWQAVFLEQQLDRLKRCDRCARWFVDRGDNRRARFCGSECEQRWWTRPRRRWLSERRVAAASRTRRLLKGL